ncbi:MAG: GIY-YIG nuclease family protein [Candidatus Aenigmarchaeota archaeon]|nr:GIY-YIG nuclease family protein [Candidatus Aenigmarchaeota archaeon]
MKGVYVLIIEVKKDNITAKIGALGVVNFQKGLYAYVGSAQNNLEKRITRHKSRNKKKFWHLDYLLDGKETRVVNAYYKNAGKEEECQIAKKLSETETLIPHFGCSDCNCKTHLFKIRDTRVVLKQGLTELKE